jgi:hypothetical protein
MLSNKNIVIPQIEPIKNENELLTISEVPNDFENFVGKKSPYKFVFDIKILPFPL